jgi:hypothetical protein
MVISCEPKEQSAKEAAMERVADSYGILMDKAKETEVLLQKRADSIIRQFDSLGVPR